MTNVTQIKKKFGYPGLLNLPSCFLPKGGILMKKIMLIHTGGTFGMVPMKPSNTLAPSLIQDQILTHVPEIQKIADIDFDVVFNLDSSNIQIHHWQKLAQYIYERYSDYDGFVIIHGTDAMIYTASALSYMLRGIGKPVVLTGSQRPLAQIRSDARSNLINSMELATYPIPEVSIFFDTHLFRGNRTIKISSTQYDAFASPNYPSLAEVGLDIKLSKSVLMHPAALEFHRQLDPRVFCFRFFSGSSDSLSGISAQQPRSGRGDRSAGRWKPGDI